MPKPNSDISMTLLVWLCRYLEPHEETYDFTLKKSRKLCVYFFAANLLTREYYPKRWIILYICKHMRIDAYHLLKIQGIKVLVCTSISPFVVLSHGPESAKLSHCINRLWHSKFIKSSKNDIFPHLIAHLRQIKLIDDIERRKIANIKYVALENWNDSFMFVASGLKKNCKVLCALHVIWDREL